MTLGIRTYGEDSGLSGPAKMPQLATSHETRGEDAKFREPTPVAERNSVDTEITSSAERRDTVDGSHSPFAQQPLNITGTA